MSTVTAISDNILDVPGPVMNELEDWCAEAEDEGSHYPGMTYEQGVRDTLEWLSGDGSAPHEN